MSESLKPEFFRGIMRLLIVHSSIYYWDDERLAMNTGIPVQWAQQGDLVLNMAREWHSAPYRQKSLREIIREPARAHSDFCAFVAAAIAGSPLSRTPRRHWGLLPAP